MSGQSGAGTRESSSCVCRQPELASRGPSPEASEVLSARSAGAALWVAAALDPARPVLPYKAVNRIGCVFVGADDRASRVDAERASPSGAGNLDFCEISVM
jgi:hypothetical protein